MRFSLLDTQSASYRCLAQPATVVRVQVQPRDFPLRYQHGSQLQLCVPQMFMNGPSYRPNKRPGRVIPTTKEDIR
jgi:hypothetical protein